MYGNEVRSFQPSGSGAFSAIEVRGSHLAADKLVLRTPKSTAEIRNGRESTRTASESQEWRYLWWTLKPPSAVHAAIPCSSAENAHHRDSLAKGNEFEPPVPVSKLQTTAHHVRICDGETNCLDRAETPMRSTLLSRRSKEAFCCNKRRAPLTRACPAQKPVFTGPPED